MFFLWPWETLGVPSRLCSVDAPVQQTQCLHGSAWVLRKCWEAVQHIAPVYKDCLVMKTRPWNVRVPKLSAPCCIAIGPIPITICYNTVQKGRSTSIGTYPLARLWSGQVQRCASQDLFRGALCTLHSDRGLWCGVSQLTLPFHSYRHLQWVGKRESKETLLQVLFQSGVIWTERIRSSTDINQLPLSTVAALDLAQIFFRSSENIRYFWHH